MGGLALPTESDPPFWSKDQAAPVLTVEGFGHICKAHPHLVPNISQNFLKDQSRRDGLLEVLVCTQALWFVLQCAVRLTRDCPITLLELSTLGHVVSTFIIYLFWWSKPYDIRSPLVLQGEDAHRLAAATLIYMKQPPAPPPKQEKWYEQLVSTYRASSGRQPEPTTTLESAHLMTSADFPAGPVSPDQTSHPNDRHHHALGTEYFDDQPPQRGSDGQAPRSRRGTARAKPPAEHSRAMLAKLPYLDGRLARHSLGELWCGSMVLGTAYAALHWLGFNAAFPNAIEQLLWRLCAAYVGLFSSSVYGWLPFFADGRWAGRGDGGGCRVMVRLCVVAGSVYFAARLFLAVEAFANLRYSPVGVYQVVPWAPYFPHFG
ncbi:hypothetical protein MBLNU459_g7800t1 [Dothideomycetes sp. NU459]